MLLAIGVAFGYNTLAYIGSIWTVNYAIQRGYSDTESLLLQVLGSIAFMVAAPAMGLLSDRFGRKPVVISGARLRGVLLRVLPDGRRAPAVAGHLRVRHRERADGGSPGLHPGVSRRAVPRATRYSSISATYQTGAALGGGTASTVAAALFITFDGNPLGVALYSARAALVLALCASGLRETARTRTADLGTVADSASSTAAPVFA